MHCNSTDEITATAVRVVTKLILNGESEWNDCYGIRIVSEAEFRLQLASEKDVK